MENEVILFYINVTKCFGATSARNMQDLYKVNDIIILKNRNQIPKKVEDHAMFLDERHGNNEINVNFKFIFQKL